MCKQTNFTRIVTLLLSRGAGLPVDPYIYIYIQDIILRTCILYPMCKQARVIEYTIQMQSQFKSVHWIALAFVT